MLRSRRNGVSNRFRAALYGLFFALVGTLDAHSGTPSKTLTLVTAPYPPFVHDAGNPQGEGIDIDIAREALKRGGYEIEVLLVPWKRALLQLELGEADFTTTISRNGDRDSFINWSQGYRSWVRYHFYSRINATDVLKDLTDLDGKSLGVTLGYFYPDVIAKPVGTQVRIESGINMAATIRMLQAGRTDYIVVNALAGAWEINQLGLMGELKRQPLVYSSDSPTYMGFSKARANSGALKAMDKGLSSMAKDGTLARIEKKYSP